MPRICKDGRIVGQNNKSAGDHLGTPAEDKSREEKRAYERAYRSENRDRMHRLFKRYGDKLTDDVFEHYSFGQPIKCTRCGITDRDVLCIDHIEGNGKDHLLSNGRRAGGTNFYMKLRQQGFPEGFQILCRNCNWKKSLNEDRRKVDARNYNK